MFSFGAGPSAEARFATLVPVFVGARYFEFWRPGLAAYLAWEEWALRRGHEDLAPYYVIEASCDDTGI